ncbi:S26 family signal peptidase [Mesorhizobium sp. NZP2298]|uniref:S26 family signal peptidase n=1 Tax=Mesorhizobium sp. NZP2298 TaxID=2483403 RepID=UPI001552BA61|nr:S26 family signal peptidase [Mesorhizobium sp. NZP2298]QKC98375.1 S26 family signal peptidase [Mesorhizobium sp. NZP2298]
MSARAMTIAMILGGAALVALPVWVGHRPRLIWNASASVPIGLYSVEAGDKIDIADLAVVIPPKSLATFLAERGYLPNGVPLLKRVVALGGQTVCRSGATITIGGVILGYARERDSRGRALPLWQGCRAIANNEVFLMNRDAPDSFDGRYFGPLSLASIIGRAVPIWTEDGSSLAPSGSNHSVPGEL